MSFPKLFRTKGYVPTCYSPVCHSPCGAFDLHVLSLPPAFALSQDQTLKLEMYPRLSQVDHRPKPTIPQSRLDGAPLHPAPISRHQTKRASKTRNSIIPSFHQTLKPNETAKKPPSALLFLPIMSNSRRPSEKNLTPLEGQTRPLPTGASFCTTIVVWERIRPAAPRQRVPSVWGVYRGSFFSCQHVF